MRDDRDRGYILRNTGVDAGAIEIVETNSEGHTVVTEVLRHDRKTQVLRFNLPTGELYESTTVYRPLPLPDNYQPDDVPDPDETPELETPQEPAETPSEAA
jgi:hypothetical protein